MRYCPSCNKMVTCKMPLNQWILSIVLIFIMVIPGVIYLALHANRCPECGKRTKPRII